MPGGRAVTRGNRRVDHTHGSARRACPCGTGSRARLPDGLGWKQIVRSLARARQPATLPEGKTPVNTQHSVTRARGPVARVALLGACLVVAACGDNQNWENKPVYVTVGGSVTGLSGTLVLQNNAQDDLTQSASGPFTFK